MHFQSNDGLTQTMDRVFFNFFAHVFPSLIKANVHAYKTGCFELQRVVVFSLNDLVINAKGLVLSACNLNGCANQINMMLVNAC